MVCVPVQCPYYQSAEVMKAGKQANGLRRKAQLKTSDIITLYDPRSQDIELLRWRLERVLRRVRSGPLRIACMTSFTLAFSNAHCIAICRQVREILEGVDRERPQRQQLQVQTRQQQAQARQQQEMRALKAQNEQLQAALAQQHRAVMARLAHLEAAARRATLARR